MATRIHGSPTDFWDGTTVYNAGTNPRGGTTVGIGGYSAWVNLSRGNDQMLIYATVSAAATLTLEVGHHGAATSDGNEPNAASAPASSFPLSYINTGTPIQIVAAGAGSFAIQIPDISFQWCRLKTSAALATVTAGWEATGE